MDNDLNDLKNNSGEKTPEIDRRRKEHSEMGAFSPHENCSLKDFEKATLEADSYCSTADLNQKISIEDFNRAAYQAEGESTAQDPVYELSTEHFDQATRQADRDTAAENLSLPNWFKLSETGLNSDKPDFTQFNNFCDNLQADIIGRYGAFMDMQTMKNVDEKFSESILLTDLKHDKYCREKGAIGYYNGEKTVILNDSNYSPESIAVHECMHFLSDNGVTEDRKMPGCYCEHWGIAENVMDSKGGRLAVRNERINEGLTELYAQRERESLGLATDEGKFYQNEVIIARYLEQCMGKDFVAEAYFSGRADLIENRFNQVLENDRAWEQFSYAVNRLSRSQNPGEADYHREQVYNYLADYLNKTRK